jgi:hypothetical protein
LQVDALALGYEDFLLFLQVIVFYAELAIDCSILEGLMRDITDKGYLAFLFSEGYLRHVV